MEELNKIGLHLSPLKTKILTDVGVGAPLYLDIAGSMLEVLMHADVHKYLGRQISGNLSQRQVAELHHMIRVAWYKFQRHRKVLTNKHVSIKLRLKLFDAVVTPTILYGNPLSASKVGCVAKTDAQINRWLGPCGKRALAHDHAPDEVAGECGPRAPHAGSLDQTIGSLAT